MRSNITQPRTHAWRAFGVVFLLAVIGATLTACGGNAVPPGTTNTNYGKTATSTVSGPKTGTVAGRSTKSITQDVPRRSQTPKPKTTPKKTAAIPFKPIAAETLTGLSEKAVLEKVGEPELMRGEGDIRVWQYRSDECSFDMFFSPAAQSDAKTDDRELHHMLARMRRGNEKISIQDCLDQVRKQRLSRG